MVFHRQLAIRLLDFVFGGVPVTPSTSYSLVFAISLRLGMQLEPFSKRRKGEALQDLRHLLELTALPVGRAYFLSFTSSYSASTTLPSSSFLPPPLAAPAACAAGRLRPAAACLLLAYICSASLCAACASAWVFASIFALSSDFSASSASFSAASIFAFSSALDLVAVLGQRLLHRVHHVSHWLRASTSSSAFLSSSACASASFTMRLISSSESPSSPGS